MPNPSGPDRDHKSNAGGFDSAAVDRGAATAPVESDSDTAVELPAGVDDDVTESYRAAEPATEVIASSEREQQPPAPALQRGERR